MTTTTTDVAKYQQLQQAYLSRLHAELPHLQQFAYALPELPAGAWHHHATRLLDRLHTLTTAAQQAGLQTLQQQAETLIQQLRVWITEPDTPSQDSQTAFLAQLEFLRLDELSNSELSFARPHNDDNPTLALPQLILLSNNEALAQQISVLPSMAERRFHWVSAADKLPDLRFSPDPHILVIDSFCDVTVQQVQHFTRKSAAVSTMVLGKADNFMHHLQAVRLGADGYMALPLNEAEFESWVLQHLHIPQRPTCRVLLIDSDQQLSQSYVCLLEQQQLQFEVVPDPTAIFTALSAFYPDVIVMDMQMPACSGPELARIIRLQQRWLETPIIFLASENDNTAQLQSLVQAGDDVIAKPISNHRLLATIVARAQRTRQIASMMTRDNLTGVLQHKHFTERLSLELSRAQRLMQPVTVVSIEVDHYPGITAKYDSAAANVVLCRLASLLQQQLRQTDLIGKGRLQATFLLVLPDCGTAQALKVTEQIRELFAGLSFTAGDEKFFCTFSAGLHNCQGELNAELMLEKVLHASQLSSMQGGNRTTVSTETH